MIFGLIIWCLIGVGIAFTCSVAAALGDPEMNKMNNFFGMWIGCSVVWAGISLLIYLYGVNEGLL